MDVYILSTLHFTLLYTGCVFYTPVGHYFLTNGMILIIFGMSVGIDKRNIIQFN